MISKKAKVNQLTSDSKCYLAVSGAERFQSCSMYTGDAQEMSVCFKDTAEDKAFTSRRVQVGSRGSVARLVGL